MVRCQRSVITRHLEDCYHRFVDRVEKFGGMNAPFGYDKWDYLVFHALYDKLEHKSCARLCFRVEEELKTFFISSIIRFFRLER